MLSSHFLNFTWNVITFCIAACTRTSSLLLASTPWNGFVGEDCDFFKNFLINYALIKSEASAEFNRSGAVCSSSLVSWTRQPLDFYWLFMLSNSPVKWNNFHLQRHSSVHEWIFYDIDISFCRKCWVFLFLSRWWLASFLVQLIYSRQIFTIDSASLHFTSTSQLAPSRTDFVFGGNWKLFSSFKVKLEVESVGWRWDILSSMC